MKNKKNFKFIEALKVTGMNRRQCAEYLERDESTIGRYLNGELKVPSIIYYSLSFYNLFLSVND